MDRKKLHFLISVFDLVIGRFFLRKKVICPTTYKILKLVNKNGLKSYMRVWVVVVVVVVVLVLVIFHKAEIETAPRLSRKYLADSYHRPMHRHRLRQPSADASAIG